MLKIASSFYEYFRVEADPEMLPFSSFITWDDGKMTSLDGDDCPIKEVGSKQSLMAFFQDLYASRMTIEYQGETTTMRVLMYIPLYDKSYVQKYQELVATLSQMNRPFAIDVMGLSSDFMGKINGIETEKIDTVKNAKTEAECIDSIVKYEGDGANLRGRFLVIQDFNETGLSLNLTIDMLVRILAEYAMVVTEAYNKVYPMAINPGHVTGMGMTVLYLDTVYFVNYLLRKAFLQVLDNENIMQDKVDVNQLQSVVQAILKDNIDIFNNFYDQHVKPCLEKKMSDDQIIAQTSPELKVFFAELLQKFQGLVAAKEMSLPAKQAAFALLLGLDDVLLEGYMYNKDVLDIDNGYETPVNLFVDVNNSLVGEEGFEKSGPIQTSLDKDGYAHFALQPLKELKADMRQISNGIRHWEEDLKALSKQSQIKHESTKRLVGGQFVYGDVSYKILPEVVQEPLQLTYEPKETRKESVDLRASFTDIRDQGAVGSCCTFATTSIYEYILKRGGDPSPDLSERFVFYHSNVIPGTIKEGASYKQIIDTIAEHGICKEDLCPYIVDQIETRPSDAAFADAKQHLIQEAMNVRTKHEDITSALSEGYPVGISLRIVDSFGSCYKGFVNIPTEEDLAATEAGYHAMVVVGYSEKDKVYIVRNSWGTHFGDQGYCYIPFSYVDNPELNPYCCIVTKTADAVDVHAETTETKVDFNVADNTIRSILLEIKIGEEKAKLAKMEETYKDLQLQFQTLVLTLEDQAIRERISKESLTLLKKDLVEKEEKYNQFSDEVPEKVREFKAGRIKKGIRLAVLTVLILLGYIACGFVVRSQVKGLVERQEKKEAITEVILDYVKANGDTPTDQFKRMLARQDYSGEKTVEAIKDKMMGLMVSGGYRAAAKDFDQERNTVFPGISFTEKLLGIIKKICLYAFIALLLVCIYIFSKIAQDTKKYRRELDEERDRMSRDIYQLKNEIKIRPIKLHLAGMVIDRLSELKTQLTNKYHLSVSYVGNLRSWYTEEQSSYISLKEVARQKPPFLTVLDDNVLDSYFESQKQEMLKDVRFGDLLDDFDVVDDAKIEEHKQRLIDMVSNRLKAIVADFSMTDYLMGKVKYAYLPDDQKKKAAILADLYKKSNIFLRYNQLDPTDSINECFYMLANVPDAKRDDWIHAYGVNFMNMPVDLPCDTKSKVVLLRTLELNKDDIVLLQSE